MALLLLYGHLTLSAAYGTPPPYGEEGHKAGRDMPGRPYGNRGRRRTGRYLYGERERRPASPSYMGRRGTATQRSPSALPKIQEPYGASLYVRVWQEGRTRGARTIVVRGRAGG